MHVCMYVYVCVCVGVCVYAHYDTDEEVRGQLAESIRLPRGLWGLNSGCKS